VAPRYEKSIAYHDFGDADRDKNRALSLEEYKETNYAMERVIYEESDGYAATFKELDEDGNGAVGVEEYLAVAGVDRFSRIDRNRDGRLSPDEYLRDEMGHSRYHHDGISQGHLADRVRGIFANLDHNKDGFLTRAEERGHAVHHQEDALQLEHHQLHEGQALRFESYPTEGEEEEDYQDHVEIERKLKLYTGVDSAEKLTRYDPKKKEQLGYRDIDTDVDL